MIQKIQERYKGKSDAPFYSAGDIENKTTTELSHEIQDTGIKYLLDDFEVHLLMGRTADNEKFFRFARKHINKTDDKKTYLIIEPGWVTASLKEDGIEGKWMFDIRGLKPVDMLFKALWSAYIE